MMSTRDDVRPQRQTLGTLRPTEEPLIGPLDIIVTHRQPHSR